MAEIIVNEDETKKTTNSDEELKEEVKEIKETIEDKEKKEEIKKTIEEAIR